MFLSKGGTFEIEVTFQYKNVLLKNSKPSLIDKHTVLRHKVFFKSLSQDFYIVAMYDK